MRHIIRRTYRELERISGELRQIADKGFPMPEELRRISVQLDLEIGGLFVYLLFDGEIPHRSLVKAIQSGEISSISDNPHLSKAARQRLQQVLGAFKKNIIESNIWTGYADLARDIKGGHEKELAEYYGISGPELAELKSELQRKGWLD